MAKRHHKPREEQQRDRDNRANQKNPNNDRYWKARGLPGRPPSEPRPKHPPKARK